MIVFSVRVVQVQLIQQGDQQILVKVVCAAGSNWQAIKESTEQIVRNLTGQEMAVESQQVTEIPREPGGKVRVELRTKVAEVDLLVNDTAESTSSFAQATPTLRTSRLVPPKPGIKPSFTSGWPKRALLEA